jgi:hypothetical protein
VSFDKPGGLRSWDPGLRRIFKVSLWKQKIARSESAWANKNEKSEKMAYNDICSGMRALEFRYVASDLNVARTVGIVNEICRSLVYGKKRIR